MKAIQISIDEQLLSRLDASEEVKRHGRSAVLRRAADEYLKQRNEERIADQYRRAYAQNPGLGPEFEGWEDQGEWPDS